MWLGILAGAGLFAYSYDKHHSLISSLVIGVCAIVFFWAIGKLFERRKLTNTSSDLYDEYLLESNQRLTTSAAIEEERTRLHEQRPDAGQPEADWLKDCRVWMYRGAWAEWEIADIEMCVPMSPEELREKRNAILRHQSQMESAPFLGNDERLFWQRAEDRNRETAQRYDELGLASYEAMEAFVEYRF